MLSIPSLRAWAVIWVNNFTNPANPPHIQTTCFQRFKFKAITVSELRKLLSGLNTLKPHGTDGIMARSLKVAAKELSFPIATIFNFSLMTGTIPGEWKQAVVTPILKRGIVGIPLTIDR